MGVRRRFNIGHRRYLDGERYCPVRPLRQLADHRVFQESNRTGGWGDNSRDGPAVSHRAGFLLVFYLGGKMVFSAYYEYKRRWEAYQEERFEEGRKAERARQKRALEESGVTLPPEAEKILFGDTDDSFWEPDY